MSSHATSQYLGSPCLYVCNWDWCRNCYTTRTERNAHLIKDHVRQAVPVFRRDLLVLRMAQEGIGKSFSLSGVMGSHAFVVSQDSGPDKALTQDSAQAPTSSLPSPPATSPIAYSPPPFLESAPHPRKDIPSNASDDPHGIHSEKTRKLSTVTPPPDKTLFVSSGRHTPTFASLSSSRSASPALPNNPNSPDLNSLIANALGEKRPHETDSRSGDRALKRARYAWLSHDSPSSSDDSVERQLTQTPEMDPDVDAVGEPDDEYTAKNSSVQSQMSDSSVQPAQSQNLYAGEINWPSGEKASQIGNRSPVDSSSQSPIRLNTSPQTPVIPSASSPHPLVQRQAWYQAPRPHIPRKKSASAKSSKTDATRAGSNSTNKPATRTQNASETVFTSPLPAKSFRSGSLRITQTKGSMNSEPSSPAEVAYNNVDSQSNSDLAQSQSSSQPFSYVLQTQAPYQSQSLSQL